MSYKAEFQMREELLEIVQEKIVPFLERSMDLTGGVWHYHMILLNSQGPKIMVLSSLTDPKMHPVLMQYLIDDYKRKNYAHQSLHSMRTRSNSDEQEG